MNFQKVAVIGTGTLGTQIAIQAACFGYTISAYDVDRESFLRSQAYLLSAIKRTGGKRLPSPEQWEKTAKQIKRCDELAEALVDADLVIEAVVEDLSVKRTVFQEIDALAPEKTIVATNSSSIPISRIENATSRPDRCVNMHFYFPALGTNMVDVMGGTKTTTEVMEACKAWVRSIGCVPLTVKKESFGFCFNRIWHAVKREALHLWAEGYVDFTDIDRAWMIFTGMKQGPFGIMDNVGLDVAYDIEMLYYHESNDPHDRPPDALAAMIEKKELGAKTGKGFYRYPHPEYRKPDFLAG
ncbi:MAG: 3-hydroxyacyl-CoA dehydrogenase NAD-binding domain-containing protein [Deltaproteobacteria bacterium]|nr:3-hydroxyacyl-CoA dehydrogenase NAD-binding domain-containing protein [Deltaproteobacteria bacterium]